MFAQYFDYKDGELFWKAKTHPNSKMNIGDKAGTIRPDGYFRVQLFGKFYSVHRVVWEMFNTVIPKGMQVDHINSNTSDNRIENLQLVTHKQNQQRRTGSKGYQYCKGIIARPYRAHKRFNNKTYHLGCFGTACGAYMSNRMFFIGGY
jgi:hypothetical protein